MSEEHKIEYSSDRSRGMMTSRGVMTSPERAGLERVVAGHTANMVIVVGSDSTGPCDILLTVGGCCN